MKNLKVWFNDKNATYEAEIKDGRGITESATIQKTWIALMIWIKDHGITNDEYINASFNY